MYVHCIPIVVGGEGGAVPGSDTDGVVQMAAR